MKTHSFNFRQSHRSSDASAVLIILVLLTIMVVLVAANTSSLNRLAQRVKTVDQSQNQRLASFSTNQPNSK